MVMKFDSMQRLSEIYTDFSITQILEYLGQMLLILDEKAEIEYAAGKEARELIYKMSNGRMITLIIMENAC